MSLPPIDEYALNPQQLKTGLQTIKKRQRNLTLLTFTSVSVLIVSAVMLFIQHDMVYSFFGLSSSVQQLHIPVSAGDLTYQLGESSDYFLNFLSFIGWLFLKLIVSFIGAFFLVGFLRKFQFFRIRFQSFVLKFVGWILSFIVLWSGLTYVQYDLNHDDRAADQKLVHYEKNIQESQLAFEMEDAQLAKPVQAYLLAQAALMHKPVDRATAIPLVQSLINTEQQNPAKFREYGFQPEQLWAMQNQLFDKTMTPMAQSVEKQVQQANVVEVVVRWVLITVIVLTLVLSLILYLLSQHFKSRINRIEQGLH